MTGLWIMEVEQSVFFHDLSINSSLGFLLILSEPSVFLDSFLNQLCASLSFHQVDQEAVLEGDVGINLWFAVASNVESSVIWVDVCRLGYRRQNPGMAKCRLAQCKSGFN